MIQTLAFAFHALLFVSGSLAGSLFNGGQTFILTPNMTTACDAAFNTTLDCAADYIQLITYPIAQTKWNTTMLDGVCSSACNSSLGRLADAVKTGCGAQAFKFNGANMTFTDLVDHYRYKAGLTCLTGTNASGVKDYCVNIEKTWNITSMVAAGRATWPNNPVRCHFDFTTRTFDVIKDENGTCIYPFEQGWGQYDGTGVSSSGSAAALDYFTVRSDPVADGNYGWPQEMGMDDLPLEIQCNPCILYGHTSKWGDIWDEYKEQVWTNMKKNCNLTETIAPTFNMTGRGFNTSFPVEVVKPLNVTCGQTIQITDNTTCAQLALQYQFPTKGLSRLNNDLYCPRIENQAICAPLSCPIAVVNNTQSLEPFLAGYNNITWTQFLNWNPSINTRQLSQGEVVCVGPPGGAYTPTVIAPAQPTVYTTTAKAANPTATGTISNCGKYYTVQSGDTCNAVAIKFSITFSDLINMNPSIDSACSNLIAGYDYCVAPVNGTTVTPVTSTATPKSTSVTTTTGVVSSTTSGAVSTPTPTRDGMTANCTKFYKCVSGDGCYDIAQRYSITLDNFYAWNPAVKNDCSALWPDYYYCVGK